MARHPADVRELLHAQCLGVLGGIECVFAGPASLLLVDGGVPPEVQLARRFGVAITAEARPSTTHVLVPPALLVEGSLLCERTSMLLADLQALFGPDLRGVHIVDARWLLDCVSKWGRLAEAEYSLPQACLSLPLHDFARAVPVGEP